MNILAGARTGEMPGRTRTRFVVAAAAVFCEKAVKRVQRVQTVPDSVNDAGALNTLANR